LTWGDGNIDEDPMFNRSIELRPSAGSPCIDAGSNSDIAPDTADLNNNGDRAEPTPFDLGGDVRVSADVVDMGAYEYIRVPVPGDLNCDGSVDFNDIDPFIVALISRDDYESQYPACDYFNGDIDGNGPVDSDDIDGFVECLIHGGCP
jgi:hypothetical protein